MNISNIYDSAEDFRILETTGRTRTTALKLKQGEATSEKMNTHPHSDQTIVVLDGELFAEVGRERRMIHSGQCVTIPAGVAHRLRNESDHAALAFTFYCPPAYTASGHEK